MPFNILIDYDNIHTSDQNRGLEYIIDKIASKFSSTEINERNVLVRLYGGWYENNRITLKAQNLQVDILRAYPKTITLNNLTTQVIVNVELAMSLTIEPTKQLFHTYRKRGAPTGLKSKNPSLDPNCTGGNCPISHVYNFFNRGYCNQCNIVLVEDIIYKPEQKLVDTMMTADMISLAMVNKRIIIVSSDDDFWPGILTSITLGCAIYHVHTKAISTNSYYSNTVSKNYFQKSM